MEVVLVDPTVGVDVVLVAVVIDKVVAFNMLQVREKLPVPTPVYPVGHDDTHVPLNRYCLFLHMVQAPVTLLAAMYQQRLHSATQKHKALEFTIVNTVLFWAHAKDATVVVIVVVVDDVVEVVAGVDVVIVNVLDAVAVEVVI